MLIHIKLIVLLATLALAQDNFSTKCDPSQCQLPDCNCGGPSVPGGYLTRSEVPQFVLLTFDDAVSDLNKDFYAKLFTPNRTNPNGCPIRATFYVSHEWTDYSQVHDLYLNGHEIASHTVTHSQGRGFDESRWASEVVGQAEMLVRHAGVDPKDIKGMRAPFLAIGGDTMFSVLRKFGMTYDSSMPISNDDTPSWPYTLDHQMPHKCTIPPCPQKAHPSVWEIPMTAWTDERGVKCSMADSCFYPNEVEAIERIITRNFLNHYTKTKAPFPFFIHAAWFFNNQNRVKGFLNFVDRILQLPDVYFVTGQQVIDYSKRPESLDTLATSGRFSCDLRQRRANTYCSRTVCQPTHNGVKRRFTTCQLKCPQIFPWINNYQGKSNL